MGRLATHHLLRAVAQRCQALMCLPCESRGGLYSGLRETTGFYHAGRKNRSRDGGCPTSRSPGSTRVRVGAKQITQVARWRGAGGPAHADGRKGTWQYKRVLEYLSRYGIR